MYFWGIITIGSSGQLVKQGTLTGLAWDWSGRHQHHGYLPEKGCIRQSYWLYIKYRLHMVLAMFIPTTEAQRTATAADGVHCTRQTL